MAYVRVYNVYKREPHRELAFPCKLWMMSNDERTNYEYSTAMQLHMYIHKYTYINGIYTHKSRKTVLLNTLLVSMTSHVCTETTSRYWHSQTISISCMRNQRRRGSSSSRSSKRWSSGCYTSSSQQQQQEYEILVATAIAIAVRAGAGVGVGAEV